VTNLSTTTPDKPVRLDDGEDLAAFVADHDLALVDFYTKGCTLCQAIEPVVGNVARATDAAVGLLNPREDLAFVEEYDVRSVCSRTANWSADSRTAFRRPRPSWSS